MGSSRTRTRTRVPCRRILNHRATREAPGYAFLTTTEVTYLMSGVPMSTCLIPGEVNLGHMIKAVSARFLRCKVTVFPFVINHCLGGRYLEAIQISCFSSNLVLIVIFFPSFLLHLLIFKFINWNSSVRMNCLCYLLIQVLFISAWTEIFILFYGI